MRPLGAQTKIKILTKKRPSVALPGFPPSLGRLRDATYTYIFLENHGRRSC